MGGGEGNNQRKLSLIKDMAEIGKLALATGMEHKIPKFDSEHC